MEIWDKYEKFIKDYRDFISPTKYKIGNRNNYTIYNFIPAAFDIETTTQYTKDSKDKVISHYSNMYIWQFGIGQGDNYHTIFGRTWKDFSDLIKAIEKYYCLNNKKFLFFIHNNSFESAFMLKELQALGHSIKVFARKSRHPLRVDIDNKITILDSYLITGFNLETLAKNYTTTKKMIGDLDYTLLRNSKTTLTDKELQYCINDVKILCEYAEIYEKNYLSNHFMPMTSTMIAGKIIKDNCTNLKAHKKKFNLVYGAYPQNQQQYDYIMSYFTGAYTHGNLRNLFTVHENVLAVDVTSEYPYALMNGYYPVTRFKSIRKYVLEDKKAIYTMLKNYCCLVDVTFTNIRTKSGVTILSEHKVDTKSINNETLWDNGRLYYADVCEARLTEVDIETLKLHYTWDSITFNHGLYAKRGHLPDYYTLAIADLYSKKCILKGVLGFEVEYMESKKALNGQYGSLACRLNTNEIIWTVDGWNEEEHINDFDMLRKSKYVLPQWAIYCTSWSRYLILSTIAKIKSDDYIYTDTDSIKCLNKQYIHDIIDSINLEIRNNNQEWIDRLNLKELYPEVDFTEMGTFTYEKDIKYFKTLGSKRYLCQYYDDTIESTVAGLSKAAYNNYINKYSLDAFKTFTPTGLKLSDEDTQKLCTYYEDNIKEFTVVDYQGNEELVHTQSYVSLIPTSFKLSISDKLYKLYEYDQMLRRRKSIL